MITWLQFQAWWGILSHTIKNGEYSVVVFINIWYSIQIKNLPRCFLCFHYTSRTEIQLYSMYIHFKINVTHVLKEHALFIVICNNKAPTWPDRVISTCLHFTNLVELHVFGEGNYFYWLIDWRLTLTLAVFQLYHL